VLASANAATTGIGRLVADQHYATDVLVGSAAGFAVGYAIPTLLHYTAGGHGPHVAVGPLASPRALGITVSGVL
jgi:membrane-associated phospholipid phosphatase